MKRKPDESFEDYKLRRTRDQNLTRDKLRGRLFWDSKRWGTYRRKDHVK